MAVAADVLHATIFGRHFHPCPSERCQGKMRACSIQYDCQDGPMLCDVCAFIRDEYRPCVECGELVHYEDQCSHGKELSS